MREDISTADYAELIAESYINGQHKQAVKQWRRAIRAHCNPKALLLDFAAALETQNMGGESDVINLCANIFSNIDKE